MEISQFIRIVVTYLNVSIFRKTRHVLRIENTALAIRGNSVSRHNLGPIKNPPETPQYDSGGMIRGFSGLAYIEPPLHTEKYF